MLQTMYLCAYKKTRNMGYFIALKRGTRVPRYGYDICIDLQIWGSNNTGIRVMLLPFFACDVTNCGLVERHGLLCNKCR